MRTPDWSHLAAGDQARVTESILNAAPRIIPEHLIRIKDESNDRVLEAWFESPLSLQKPELVDAIFEHEDPSVFFNHVLPHEHWTNHPGRLSWLLRATQHGDTFFHVLSDLGSTKLPETEKLVLRELILSALDSSEPKLSSNEVEAAVRLLYPRPPASGRDQRVLLKLMAPAVRTANGTHIATHMRIFSGQSWVGAEIQDQAIAAALSHYDEWVTKTGYNDPWPWEKIQLALGALEVAQSSLNHGKPIPPSVLEILKRKHFRSAIQDAIRDGKITADAAGRVLQQVPQSCLVSAVRDLQ
jgi:hypothetical protein